MNARWLLSALVASAFLALCGFAGWRIGSLGVAQHARSGAVTEPDDHSIPESPQTETQAPPIKKATGMIMAVIHEVRRVSLKELDSFGIHVSIVEREIAAPGLQVLIANHSCSPRDMLGVSMAVFESELDPAAVAHDPDSWMTSSRPPMRVVRRESSKAGPWIFVFSESELPKACLRIGMNLPEKDGMRVFGTFYLLASDLPNRANKSLQPTATAVTPPAAQEIVPAVAVAEH
jgi:hypothetical protein